MCTSHVDDVSGGSFKVSSLKFQVSSSNYKVKGKPACLGPFIDQLVSPVPRRVRDLKLLELDTWNLPIPGRCLVRVVVLELVGEGFVE
jgi:hypothetical protein